MALDTSQFRYSKSFIKVFFLLVAVTAVYKLLIHKVSSNFIINTCSYRVTVISINTCSYRITVISMLPFLSIPKTFFIILSICSSVSRSESELSELSS